MHFDENKLSAKSKKLDVRVIIFYSSSVRCDRRDDEHEVEADHKFKNKRLQVSARWNGNTSMEIRVENAFESKRCTYRPDNLCCKICGNLDGTKEDKIRKMDKMPPNIFEIKMNANVLNYLADMVLYEKSKWTPFPRGCACTPISRILFMHMCKHTGPIRNPFRPNSSSGASWLVAYIITRDPLDVDSNELYHKTKEAMRHYDLDMRRTST